MCHHGIRFDLPEAALRTLLASIAVRMVHAINPVRQLPIDVRVECLRRTAETGGECAARSSRSGFFEGSGRELQVVHRNLGLERLAGPFDFEAHAQ